MTESLRVLVVEDDTAYARLLGTFLDEAEPGVYRVTHCASLSEARELLTTDSSFDVILLDLGLPDADGTDAVVGIRASTLRCPIVVLSGVNDLETSLESMRNGAQEYLVKGQSEQHILPRAIRSAIERRRMQEVEQLLTGVAGHDLRGPMQTIALACELLESYQTDARAKDYLSRAQRAAKRATGLICDLLDATRIRVGGSLPVELAREDVVPIVSQLVEEARIANPANQLRLRAPDSSLANIDGGRIGQAVGNLLGNAIQHGAADAPITITVEARESVLEISVHNFGTPIPPPLIRRLFEPLERAQSRRGERSHSIGLGLYIAYEIASTHGGSLEVESSAERGTTFRLILPSAAAEAA